MHLFIEGKKRRRIDAANQYFWRDENSFLKTHISIKDPNQQKLINVFFSSSSSSSTRFSRESYSTDNSSLDSNQEYRSMRFYSLLST